MDDTKAAALLLAEKTRIIDLLRDATVADRCFRSRGGDGRVVDRRADGVGLELAGDFKHPPTLCRLRTPCFFHLARV